MARRRVEEDVGGEARRERVGIPAAPPRIMVGKVVPASELLLKNPTATPAGVAGALKTLPTIAAPLTVLLKPPWGAESTRTWTKGPEAGGVKVFPASVTFREAPDHTPVWHPLKVLPCARTAASAA